MLSLLNLVYFSWNTHYLADIEGQDDEVEEDALLTDPVDLETWFDDVGAPGKILEFLTSDSFPLSASFGGTSDSPNAAAPHPSVLDLGTGNGSSLLTLRLQGFYQGYMVGIDYSPQSIELARKLSQQYGIAADRIEMSVQHPGERQSYDKIRFEVFDLLKDNPRTQDWWPSSLNGKGGFDLVLDKGTFDAISLSSDIVDLEGKALRVHEVYPRIVLSLLSEGGFLLITSCNWTEAEVINWFTTGSGVAGKMDVFDRISYPVFEFGGHKGQGVASVCFRRRIE